MTFRLSLFAFLLWSQMAAAQITDEPPSIPPGEDHIEGLRRGQPALSDGMLFDTNTSIRWLHRIQWYQLELQLHDHAAAERLQLEQDSAARQQQLTEESFQREVTGLRTDLRTQATQYATSLAAARHQEFYESWGFSFALGVVLTGILVGVTLGLAAGL